MKKYLPPSSLGFFHVFIKYFVTNNIERWFPRKIVWGRATQLGLNSVVPLIKEITTYKTAYCIY